jgi:pre-mRNA-splicing factor SYF1
LKLTIYQSEEDTIYEQDILRDPGITKPWLAYIEFKFQHGTLQEQAFVLERACTALPRSYKLWKMVWIQMLAHWENILLTFTSI